MGKAGPGGPGCPRHPGALGAPKRSWGSQDQGGQGPPGPWGSLGDWETLDPVVQGPQRLLGSRGTLDPVVQGPPGGLGPWGTLDQGARVAPGAWGPWSPGPGFPQPPRSPLGAGETLHRGPCTARCRVSLDPRSKVSPAPCALPARPALFGDLRQHRNDAFPKHCLYFLFQKPNDSRFTGPVGHPLPLCPANNYKCLEARQKSSQTCVVDFFIFWGNSNN